MRVGVGRGGLPNTGAGVEPAQVPHGTGTDA